MSTEPVITGSSYLEIDTQQPRTALMTRDYARNRDSVNVKRWMGLYLREGTIQNNNLMSFYKNANPFRRMIETVARAMDVSPAFAYITVIESTYFTGGQYQIQANRKSTALGPFQFLDKTAASMNLRGGRGKNDERRFFAPSACAGAKYIGQLVDQFKEGDSTVAILGYSQGEAGAAEAIVCSMDKKNCFGDWGRFITMAQKYDFTFQTIDEVGAIPQAQRDYVNNKLAIYFLSSDMAGYDLAIPADAPRTLPNNGTVVPTLPIQDSVCRSIISSMDL
jgi:hypothetical protein